MDLFKVVVIRMDWWMIVLDDGIMDFCSRFMWDNILIYNYFYILNENLVVMMFKVFWEIFGIDVDFIYIYRNGVRV